jgi:hypothetical protein
MAGKWCGRLLKMDDRMHIAAMVLAGLAELRAPRDDMDVIPVDEQVEMAVIYADALLARLKTV